MNIYVIQYSLVQPINLYECSFDSYGKLSEYLRNILAGSSQF